METSPRIDDIPSQTEAPLSEEQEYLNDTDRRSVFPEHEENSTRPRINRTVRQRRAIPAAERARKKRYIAVSRESVRATVVLRKSVYT